MKILFLGFHSDAYFHQLSNNRKILSCAHFLKILVTFQIFISVAYVCTEVSEEKLNSSSKLLQLLSTIFNLLRISRISLQIIEGHKSIPQTSKYKQKNHHKSYPNKYFENFYSRIRGKFRTLETVQNSTTQTLL